MEQLTRWRLNGYDSLASAVVARVLANPDGNDQRQPWKESHARLDRAYQTWAIQTLQQVAQGLAAAHAAGILHRDIKPANIVFAANGVPKIVDFGLARTTQAPSTTVMGEFYGTPAYTSPEQARGDVEAISPASDVFSFGVTLFECLSLGRPFPGRTAADVLSAVLNSDAPLLRQAEKRIPWELEAITDKCLRKNPGDRYASAQALADDLRNYLDLRPVSARPMSKIGRVGRTIRRQPWVAAFLCVLVVAAVLCVILAKNKWDQQRVEQEAEKVKQEEENRKAFARRVDEGDVALFRCLNGQRPTWLPAVIEKHRQQGISAYSAALEIDPAAVWPLVQRGRLYASKKETLDLALADLDKAQQLQPAFGSIRKFQGFVLDELDRKEEGQAAREKATSLYPTTAEDLYWLGVIAHSKEQDFAASYTYFSQALLIAPNDYWSRSERAYYGRIATEEGAATGKRVIPELEIAKTLRPDLPFASELLVHFYATARLDGLDESRQELTEQIERFGLDVLRAHDMAELLQKKKNYDEAGTILRKVLDQDPGGETAVKIGDLEYKMGHYESARDWYQRAITEGRTQPIVYLHLANAFTAMQDWSSAEKTYLDGMAEHPEEAHLIWNLGLWYEARGRITDAEKAYRKGCELKGVFAACFRELASLLGRLGRQAESVQVLERGIAQLEISLAAAKRDRAQKGEASGPAIDVDIVGLKESLGEAYIFGGRREDAFALIDAELKRRPIAVHRARVLINLLNRLGIQQVALEVGRLAEFTSHQQNPPTGSYQNVARGLVDGQLAKMGLFRELRDRLEARRALGEQISVEEYGWLGMNIYQGPEAVAILSEGVKRYADSVLLQSDYMEVLAKAGRKEEAWKAYERARDLYFALLERWETPRLGGDYITEPITVLRVRPWYIFLLQEGKDEEFRRLEKRLREMCRKTGDDPKSLLLPRAFAEFATGRYAAAVESLESCVQLKVWNEVVNEVMVTGLFARSLRLVGRRQDAIKQYRRAVQISGVDPGFLSEFLSLVVEEEGVDGLRRELPAYDQVRSRLDVRLNATLSCFSSWAALARGDEKAAFEHLVLAGPYVLMAGQQPVFGGDEGLVCGVILQIVAEKLADSKRLVGVTEFLKRFPAERVKAMRELFLLPKRK